MTFLLSSGRPGEVRSAWIRSLIASAVVLGGVASASDAAAFCRTTTVALPANYNPASRGCFTDGLLLYWRNQCVGYSINQAASREVPFDTAKQIIDEAFARWMSVTCAGTEKPPGITVSDLGTAVCDEVRYNPDAANQNLIVFRDDSWPYNDPNNTLGLTTVTFDADTGEIFDADMEINSSAHNLSITDKVPANGFDLASVITHEAGHFLGLAHATSTTSTMFASYKPGTTALRTLSPDDINGVCAIYPNSDTRIVSATTAQAPTVPATTCDPTPRHGLTQQCYTPPPKESSCSVVGGLGSTSATSAKTTDGALGLGLALTALARRRSRRVRA